MKKAVEKAEKTEAETNAKRTQNLPRMFAQADANGDGKVTAEELKNTLNPAKKIAK